MKELTLPFLFSFIQVTQLFSQELSSQAQAILDRLPPDQKAMAISQMDRLRRDDYQGEKTSDITEIDEEQEDKSLNHLKDLDNLEQDEELEEDKLAILEKLQLSVDFDLDQEKKKLLEAQEKLSTEDFLKVAQTYNDRITDLEKLLDDIKTFKIQFLKEKITALEGDDEEEYKPFGYEFFNNSILSFRQEDINSIPSDYNIGAGDFIEIQLFGKKNAGYTIKIGRNGIVQFPEIGPINAFEKGSSFENFKNLIKEKVNENFGEGVQVSVSMGEVRLIKIFLAGEFLEPGVLFLPATSTIVDALLRSQGINDYGSLRNITLKRKTEQKKVYDFYDLLLKGENPATESLLDGDVVFLPKVEERILVKGEVGRPAFYELDELNSLANVIEMAGGFTSKAFTKEIRLLRKDRFGNKLLKFLPFDLNQDFELINGDIIEVGSDTQFVKTAIELSGEVDRVGEYEWNVDTKLSDIITNKWIFKDDADLNYAVIRRLNVGGSVEVLSFSPQKLIEGNFDMPLFQKDRVIILPKFDENLRERVLRPILNELHFDAKPAVGADIVTISGEIHFPGDYPMTKDMVVSDLIVAAGGMKESAFALSAEISRVKLDTSSVDASARIEHLLIESLSAENSLNLKLKQGDVLSIKKIPSWEENQVVDLSGEVRFPGSYAIRKNEKISDLITRAGGLTEDAFSKGAVFTRKSLAEREDKQTQKLIEQLESDLAAVSLSPTGQETAEQANSIAQSLLNRLKNSKPVGRLVIDLEEQINLGDDSKINLKNGDKLHIPAIPSEVSVMGEVQFPTSHLHQPKLSDDAYIRLSGGFTQNADTKRVFVVKSNGAVLAAKGHGWFNGVSGEKEIQPGDVVVVPINLQKGKWLETLTSGSQIVYQLAVTAAALNSFNF